MDNRMHRMIVGLIYVIVVACVVSSCDSEKRLYETKKFTNLNAQERYQLILYIYNTNDKEFMKNRFNDALKSMFDSDFEIRKDALGVIGALRNKINSVTDSKIIDVFLKAADDDDAPVAVYAIRHLSDYKEKSAILVLKKIANKRIGTEIGKEANRAVEILSQN